MPSIDKDATTSSSRKTKSRCEHVNDLPAKSRGEEMVTLLVGPAKSLDDNANTPVKFEVRQDLLEECSSFFRMMLSRPKSGAATNANGKRGEDVESEVVANWKEGQTKIVEMPEVRPEDVKMLLQWLTSGGPKKNNLNVDLYPVKDRETLCSKFLNDQPGLAHAETDDAVIELYRPGSGPKSSLEEKSLFAPNLEYLINLYILADKYDIEPNHDFSVSSLPPWGGLRRQIVHRIRAIWRLGDILVLDVNDIERLWTSVPVDTEGDMGLKDAFIERLACQEFKTLRLYFTVRSWMNDRQMKLSVGSRKREDRVWHAEFLQDLMVRRTFWEEAELQEAYGTRTIGY